MVPPEPVAVTPVPPRIWPLPDTFTFTVVPFCVPVMAMYAPISPVSPLAGSIHTAPSCPATR
jgi:hypothetical protein